MRGRRLLASCAIALSCLIKDARASAQQTFDQAYEGAGSPRNASYDISVRLDFEARTIRGIEIIRWRNISDEFTRELYVHVPPEASLTRLEAKQPDGRLVTFPAAADRMLRIALPWEVVPLETVEMYVEWNAPARGTDAASMVRWFPKIAVLEDAGWNRAILTADYGSYDVQITLPAAFAVSATGFEVYWLENPDGSVTHRYRAEDVRDFTWHARRRPDGRRPWLLVPLVQVGASLVLALTWRSLRA